MNPNNLHQISSFTTAKHLQIQATVRRAQGRNSDIPKFKYFRENITMLSKTGGRLI